MVYVLAGHEVLCVAPNCGYLLPSVKKSRGGVLGIMASLEINLFLLTKISVSTVDK